MGQAFGMSEAQSHGLELLVLNLFLLPVCCCCCCCCYLLVRLVRRGNWCEAKVATEEEDGDNEVDPREGDQDEELAGHDVARRKGAHPSVKARHVRLVDTETEAGGRSNRKLRASTTRKCNTRRTRGSVSKSGPHLSRTSYAAPGADAEPEREDSVDLTEQPAFEACTSEWKGIVADMD